MRLFQPLQLKRHQAPSGPLASTEHEDQMTLFPLKPFVSRSVTQTTL